MTGGVYSARGAMKEIVPDKSAGQPSQTMATRSPRCIAGRSASGMKNRTKIFPGGNSDTTGAPAAMVSPGRANTSAMRPAAGAVTWRCDSRHSVISSAAFKARMAACWASISCGRPEGARAWASAASSAATLAVADWKSARR